MKLHLILISILSCSTVSIAEADCANMHVSDTPITGRAIVLSNSHGYHQTTGYTCGAATIMGLMHYYGMLTDSQLNRTTEMSIFKEMHPGSGNGATVTEMSNWLSSHGFNVSVGQGVTAELLMGNLDMGIPTIIAYEQHWILAKGYQKAESSNGKDNDNIFFADSVCGKRTIVHHEVDSIWAYSYINYRATGGNRGFYIVATPSH